MFFFLKFYDGQSTNKGDCVKSKVVSVHDMKPYGKYTYSSTHLTVALHRDEWSASHPGCSMPKKVAVGSTVMSPSNKIKCQNWEVTDLICRNGELS
jgi:hypothetical protein